MTFYQHRAFQRPGVEEEEITPPCAKSRSFDSLSVAHILQAKLDSRVLTPAPADGFGGSEKPAPVSPESPSMEAAAALLQGASAHASVNLDKAADCLMLLGAAAEGASDAAGGAAAASAPAPRKGSGKGTPGTGGAKRSAAAMSGAKADGAGPARRRLKMRAGSAGAGGAGSKRGQAAAHAAAAAAAENTLQVAGISTPVVILSGAKLHLLKLLAAAFQLCPSPSEGQIAAIARRVAVSPVKLAEWFQSRRTLQEWVQQQPHLQPADLARMFYPGAAEASVTPPPGEASDFVTKSHEAAPSPSSLPVAPVSVEL